MSQCPICNFENRVGALVCAECGSDLYDTLLEQIATKELNTQDLKTRNLDERTLPSSNPLVLYLSKDNTPLAIERSGEPIIGRSAPEEDDNSVDIDLCQFGAQELGVSRQHIRLNAAIHPPTVVDLGSYNGTFVNGQKLTPERRHILNSGDEIRLGRMTMRLYFK